MRSPALVRTAATVLAIEGAALLGFAIIELFGLGAGEAASLPTAIALIVLTLIGAAALIAFAAGTMRDRTWARSGGVVLQVLAIAIALASLTVPPVPWPFVLGVGVPGVLGFVLLIAASRQERAPETETEPDSES
ncbi:hypothetical protein [Microbacterium sp.]|uniref:hypothetical protein n=1 Tax=Microbacterium sp. TaxID=51671 RepID=UPI003F9CBF7A